MQIILLALAALLFLSHLLCETLASFVRYNFAGIGRHMQGVAVSNYFGIASRGFVAAYGVLASLIVERHYPLGWQYVLALSLTLICGGLASLLLSRINVSINATVPGKKIAFQHGAGMLYFYFERFFCYRVKIAWVSSVFVGVQFAAIVVAYGLCFYFPNNRLFIISLVPVIGMLGTLVTVVFVEPKLARIVDEDNSLAHAVSQEFMRARAISFFFSAAILVFLAAVLEG
ncbi:hypothetical protein [Rhodocyclus gracilis]|uniref:Uncharacterized protein n=1 Tax=Rhodocyclus tenuis TaxID=1066 RepID=A0A6L5JZL1_RHOTE|nr:hypothetical protein [Rhodocyclus gracilis]MQY52757.1 hypothetical protein [Rhodocyclus gracilis]